MNALAPIAVTPVKTLRQRAEDWVNDRYPNQPLLVRTIMIEAWSGGFFDGCEQSERYREN